MAGSVNKVILIGNLDFCATCDGRGYHIERTE